MQSGTSAKGGDVPGRNARALRWRAADRSRFLPPGPSEHGGRCEFDDVFFALPTSAFNSATPFANPLSNYKFSGASTVTRLLSVELNLSPELFNTGTASCYRLDE